MRDWLKHGLLLAFIAALVLSFAGGEAEPLSSDDEIFLYRAAEKVSPGYWPLNQGNIGTCVAVAHKGAVDGSQAVAYVNGKVKKWLQSSADSIYGGSRNEARGYQCRSYADGSNGWAATRWLEKAGGALYMQPYLVTYKDGSRETVDLSRYDIARCKEWGAWGNGGKKDGLGGPLDLAAKQHPVKLTAKVTTLEELDVALKNGFFVTICSGQGFNSPRDKDGFCEPRGAWPHCLLASGKRNGGRKGYLIQNSWGKYLKGDGTNTNKYKDQPDGSFYAEPGIVLKMLKAGDSYAIAPQTGFEPLWLPDWLTNPDADLSLVAFDDGDEEVSGNKPYQGTDGRWYFIDDQKRVLQWNERARAWYYCNGRTCTRVSAVLRVNAYARLG